MGMYGRPDSKKTNNAWHESASIQRWVTIAAKLPQNKSDPHFYNRTINYIRKDLIDFHEFIADTSKTVRTLSQESLKALKEYLSQPPLYIYLQDEELINTTQQVA